LKDLKKSVLLHSCWIRDFGA